MSERKSLLKSTAAHLRNYMCYQSKMTKSLHEKHYDSYLDKVLSSICFSIATDGRNS